MVTFECSVFPSQFPSQTISLCGKDSAFPKRNDAAEAVEEMLGESAVMKRLRLQLRRIGPYFRMVLLSGETGSGKDIAARTLHSLGAADSRFAVCSMAWRGAGAAEAREMDALLVSPEGGTVLLDKVDELPMAAQAGLLESIERWERAPRLAAKGQAVAARVIASTSQSLRTLMRSGGFREDLYYRLAMVEITVPPLRERDDDIGELAQHLLSQYGAEFGREDSLLARSAVERLKSYTWPGNVRELKNLMRKVAMESSGGLVEAQELGIPEGEPKEEWMPQTSRETPVKLQEVVDRHVHQILRQCSGNKVRAAELLGISRSTLYRMLDGGAPGGAFEIPKAQT